MNRRNFLRTAGAAAATGAAGCTGVLPGDGGGGLPDTVTVGYPSPALPVYNFALYPALERRLDDLDVALELNQFKGYTPMVNGILGGEMDVGVLSMASVVKALDQDFPLVAPVGYTREFSFALVTRPEIEKWEDLRGKTVAVHSPNSMSTVTGRVMVQERLGSRDAADFEFVIGTPNRLAELKAGNVAGAVVFLSGALQAEKDGYANVLAYPWQFERLSAQTTAALVTSRDRLENDPETFGTLVDEVLGAYETLYGGDPEQLTDEALATDRFSEFETDVWVEALGQVRDAKIWPRDGGLTKENVRKAQDVLVSTGMIEESQRVSRAAFVSDRFL